MCFPKLFLRQAEKKTGYFCGIARIHLPFALPGKDGILETRMKSLYVPVRLTILTMLLLIAFFAGCTRGAVPVAEDPLRYSQEKMRAAEHWRDVAEDVADKIRDALVERTDLLLKPLYVVPPDSRPFMLTFNKVVTSALVSRAIQVSERRESDCVVVEYDILSVTHDSSRLPLFSSASDREVVINVRMAYDNRYVLHRSYLRYINDPDWALYVNQGTLQPGGGSRLIRVTGAR